MVDLTTECKGDVILRRVVGDGLGKEEMRLKEADLGKRVRSLLTSARKKRCGCARREREAAPAAQQNSPALRLPAIWDCGA